MPIFSSASTKKDAPKASAKAKLSPPPSPKAVAVDLSPKMDPLDLSAYKVWVTAPKKAPEKKAPIYYTVTVKDVQKVQKWTITRRYNEFTEVYNELWWGRYASNDKMPSKYPKPGQDLAKIKERAAALQVWATSVLNDPKAVETAAVSAFFNIDPGRKNRAGPVRMLYRVTKKLAVNRPKGFLALLLGAALLSAAYVQSLEPEPVAAPPSKKFLGVSVPKVSMPKVSMPHVSLPSVSLPSLKGINVTMPHLSLPAVSLPKLKMPKIDKAKIMEALQSNTTKTVAVALASTAATGAIASFGVPWALAALAARGAPVVAATGMNVPLVASSSVGALGALFSLPLLFGGAPAAPAAKAAFDIIRAGKIVLGSATALVVGALM